MTTTIEDDLIHLRHEHVLEDPYFVITKYKNIPFVIAQSLSTKRYYKLTKEGRYKEPRSANPIHGTLDVNEILS